jgi:energy-coupling factor transporter ATP-binding protein EcfA2
LSLLVLEPQVLILDEPLAGLNAKERSRLASFLSRWTDHDKTMLIISHDLELFLEWVDNTAVMDQGKIIFMGSSQDLYNLTDTTVREAASLPPIVQISYYLKQFGLSEGPVTSHWPIVRQHLRDALTQRLLSLGSHTTP